MIKRERDTQIYLSGHRLDQRLCYQTFDTRHSIRHRLSLSRCSIIYSKFTWSLILWI